MEQRFLPGSVADGEKWMNAGDTKNHLPNHGPNGLRMVKRQQQRPAKHKNDGAGEQQEQKPHGTGQAQAGYPGVVYVAGCEGQLLTGA